jgi:hypothetical protein
VTKVILELFSITVQTLHVVSVPLLRPLFERERKQLPPQGFLCYARNYQARTHFLEHLQMIMGTFIDNSKEGSFPNQGKTARDKSKAKSCGRLEEGCGSKNLP